MDFRKNKFWMVLAAVLATATLASAQKIETSIDSSYNLVRLKTFAFAPLKARDPLNHNPEVAEEIRNELTADFEKIGLRKDNSNPDFLVSYTANDQAYSSNYSAVTTGVTAENQVYTSKYQVQTLVLSFVDAKTDGLFWEGTAKRTVGEGSLQKYVPKGVKKIVEAFHEDKEKQRKKGSKS